MLEEGPAAHAIQMLTDTVFFYVFAAMTLVGGHPYHHAAQCHT